MFTWQVEEGGPSRSVRPPPSLSPGGKPRKGPKGGAAACCAQGRNPWSETDGGKHKEGNRCPLGFSSLISRRRSITPPAIGPSIAFWRALWGPLGSSGEANFRSTQATHIPQAESAPRMGKQSSTCGRQGTPSSSNQARDGRRAERSHRVSERKRRPVSR